LGKQVDISNPKNIVIGAFALLAAGSAGSMLGITIEPQETTTLRVERAQLEIQVASLEAQLETQEKTSEERVVLLESIIDDCQRLINVSKERLEDQ